MVQQGAVQLKEENLQCIHIGTVQRKNQLVGLGRFKVIYVEKIELKRETTGDFESPWFWKL